MGADSVAKEVYFKVLAESKGTEKLVASITTLSNKMQAIVGVATRLKIPITDVKTTLKKLGLEVLNSTDAIDTYKNQMLNVGAVEKRVALAQKEAARDRKAQLLEVRRLQNNTARDQYKNALDNRKQLREQVRGKLMQSNLERMVSTRNVNQAHALQNKSYKESNILAIKENAMREMVNRKSSRGNALSKVSLENMTGAMRTANLTLSDTGKWTDNVTGKQVKLRDAQIKLNKTTDTFNMNYLGIMFAGMAVQKAFDGMQQSAMQAVGVTEDWSYVMADYFSPNAEYMSERIKDVEWWMDKLGPTGQGIINKFVMLGSAAGRVGFTLGQTMLGYHSIKQELPDIVRFIARKTGLAKNEAAVITKETIPAMNAEINTTKKSHVAAKKHTAQINKKTKATRRGAMSMKGLGLAAVGTVGAMALMSSEASATSEIMEDVGKTMDWIGNDVYGNFKEFCGGSSAVALLLGATIALVVWKMVLPALWKYISGTLLASKSTLILAGTSTTASGAMVGMAGSTAVASTGLLGLAAAGWAALVPLLPIIVAILAIAVALVYVGRVIVKHKDSIAKMFSGLGKSISGVFKGILSGARNVSIGISTWFSNAGTWVLDSFGNIWDFVVGIWDSFTGYICDKWDYIKEKGSGIIKKIVAYFSDLKGTIYEVLGNVKQYFSDKVSDMKVKISSFITIVKTKFNEIKSKIFTVFANIKSTIDEKIESAKVRFTEIKSKVYEVFNNIKSKVTEKLSEVKARFAEVKAKVYTVFTDIKAKVETKIEEVRSKINEKIELIKTKVGEIKTKFKDIFDTIKENISWDKLVKVGTTIMTKIAEGMASAKDIVTKAIYAIPVVGPIVEQLVDSGFFGAVPMAKGGVVTEPTLAMVGERGPEAVIPLEKMGSMGGGMNYHPNITINADINNDVDIDYLTRKINENLYNELNRQGMR